MSDLKKLKSIAKGFSVLYVEDNRALRENAASFLRKIFDEVDTAEDGEDGLEKFKQHNYSVVITDIRMPKMDGISLARNIKNIDSDAKIIIMSAFDDSEYLFNSIEIGIFRYLKKPVSVADLSDVLFLCISSIKKDDDSKLFHKHLDNVFNYQSSMVVMLEKSNLIFANQMFFSYFNIENLEEFVDKYGDLGSVFLEHEGFLYNNQNKSWLEQIHSEPNKLYNAKIQDKNGGYRHFILKYQIIPDKENYGVLSFDDITELHLLKLFDAQDSQHSEQYVKSNQDLFKFLEVVKRNNAKLELHNYYKGLTITNEGFITEIDKESVIIKTKYTQEKAIQIEGQSFIISDAMPFVIECSEVLFVNYENKTIRLGGLHFIKRSPIERKGIRIVPDEKHTASLFIDGNKLHTEIKIEDISLEAIRLSLDLMPPNLEKDGEVVIDIVLELDRKPLIINTKAVLFRKLELEHSYSLVFTFLDFNKSDLIKYISKRQMAIIREFKGLQNG